MYVTKSEEGTCFLAIIIPLAGDKICRNPRRLRAGQKLLASIKADNDKEYIHVVKMVKDGYLRVFYLNGKLKDNIPLMKAGRIDKIAISNRGKYLLTASGCRVGEDNQILLSIYELQNTTAYSLEPIQIIV